VRELSTDDIALAIAVLTSLRAKAFSRADRAMVDEFSARLRLCERELGRRQGRLFGSSGDAA
jgi:hypothetical protein